MAKKEARAADRKRMIVDLSRWNKLQLDSQGREEHHSLLTFSQKISRKIIFRILKIENLFCRLWWSLSYRLVGFVTVTSGWNHPAFVQRSASPWNLIRILNSDIFIEVWRRCMWAFREIWRIQADMDAQREGIRWTVPAIECLYWLLYLWYNKKKNCCVACMGAGNKKTGEFVIYFLYLDLLGSIDRGHFVFGATSNHR